MLLPLILAAFPQYVPQDGMTLYSLSNSKESHLIDIQGNNMHSWQGQANPGLANYLSPEGNLLRLYKISGFPGAALGGSGGGLREFDWDGQILWDFQLANTTEHLHHDLAILPNGNILALAWENVGRSSAIAAGRNPSYLQGQDFWSDRVIEIERGTGNIVWQWRIWDHVVQDYDSSLPSHGVVADHPELLSMNYPARTVNRGDWIHLNSVAYNPALDQILISSREWSEIWVIDHSTTTAEAAGHSGGRYGKGGDILYRWGNPECYDRGTSSDRLLFGQHDANWIPDGYPGESNILLYNNGNSRPSGRYSSIEEIVPAVDAQGNYTVPATSPFGPTTSHWTWTDSPPSNMYSSAISGCERQPNGNTLICCGQDGRLIEVDPAGNVVWDIQPQGSSSIFKVRRYQKWLWPGNGVLTASTGDTLELDIVAGSDRGNRDYWIVGGFSGTSPGTTLPGGIVAPLNNDAFTQFVMQKTNGPGFQSFRGTLDANGFASAKIDTMGPIPSSLIGKTAHFCFVTLNPIDFASNPIPIQIKP